MASTHDFHPSSFLVLVVLVVLSLLWTSSCLGNQDQDSLQSESSVNQTFGHGLLPRFALAKGYTNLNHGSFGSPPLEVLQAQQDNIMKMESNPDLWLRYKVFDLVYLRSFPDSDPR
jgi:hypothetical protein